MTDPKDVDNTAAAKEKNTEAPAKKAPAPKSTARTAAKSSETAKKPAAPKKAAAGKTAGTTKAATEKNAPADKPAADGATSEKPKAPAKKTTAAKKSTPSKKAAESGDAEKASQKDAAPAKKTAAKSTAGRSRKAASQTESSTAPAEPAAEAPAKAETKAAPKKTTPAKKAAAPKKAATQSRSEAVNDAPAAPNTAAMPEENRPAQAAAAPAAEETSTAGAPAESTAPAQARKTGNRSRRGGRKQAAAREESAARAEANLEAAPPAAAADAAPQAAKGPAPFADGFGDTGPEDFFAAEDTTDDGDGDQPARDGEEKRRRGRSRRGRGKKKNAAAQAENDAPEAPSAVDDEQDDDFSDDDDVADGKDQDQSSGKASRRKMFVSVLPEEQIEVVITEEGQVQEYYVEMLHQAKTKGNIYKGTIHNVDPNLQAAFVSYGAVKNGFLQIDEVHPEYYVAPHEAGKGRKYPPIQKVLKPGQEVLVQIVKEPAGTKGAFLTTYLSLPGRFLVLTPGREQIGVSRKVENEGERSRLREMLGGLNPGPGLGVIVRTVSMGASKTNLQRDLQNLKRNWKDVRTRGTTEQAPCLVYQEMELTSRAVRDYLTEAVGEVWIDDEGTATAVTEVAETLFPRKKNLVRVHTDTNMSLFERFNLQRQLDQIHSREVVLPSGGRLVIDPTEALTAIDINSGRSGGKNNFEDMAYRTNMEAAKMIPLQLRLRDIGGQVVADFIEMRDKNHWRDVERAVRNGMKVDRARYDVGKMGPFGMLEIVRQRLGSSAISISTEPCPCCNGTGMRRNVEWRSQHALRDILRAMRHAQANGETVVLYETEQPLALHLLNNKRRRLMEMEQQHGVTLEIRIRLPEAL